MWALSPIPSPPFLSRPSRPPLRPFLQPPSCSAPPKGNGVYGDDIGGFGHTNLNSSSSSPVPKRQKQKQKQADGNQLSGSDVLWALQRAAAKKKKKNNKKRREVSSANTYRSEEDDDVDLSNVKPLCIKSEWATKLKVLEQRLRELSEFN